MTIRSALLLTLVVGDFFTFTFAAAGHLVFFISNDTL